jgi:hypothetical protein
VSSSVRRALEVEGDGVSEVLGNRGGGDSEQGVEAKTMVRQGTWGFPAAMVARGWRFKARR